MADEVKTPQPAAGSTTGKPANATRAQLLVDKWVEGLRNSPLSRHTDSWNFVQKKLPGLVSLIEQEL